MKTLLKKRLIKRISEEMCDWRTIKEVEDANFIQEHYEQAIQKCVEDIFNEEEFKELWKTT